MLTKVVATVGDPTEADIRTALVAHGIALNGADDVFYLSESTAEDILGDSIGSMHPWDDEFPLADIGVLTIDSARSRGHAKTLVCGMFRHALTEGYEPQYRRQLGNATSVKLAESLDLQLFGQWEIAMPDCTALPPTEPERHVGIDG